MKTWNAANDKTSKKHSHKISYLKSKLFTQRISENMHKNQTNMGIISDCMFARSKIEDKFTIWNIC